MQANFVLDYNVLTVERPQKVYLMAHLVSGPAPGGNRRRPLNLSVAIDRSGSMAGDKIEYTRQAAQFLVQNLGVNDMVSIVLYNDTVETLLAPEKVQRKDIINQRISTIKPSGTTNLSSGWLESCNLVSQNKSSECLNRVILMSDGLANRGVTDTEQLVTLARQKFDDGVSTTTMGLGKDFNEDLLMSMASAGGGAFYFIESPEVTPLIFKEELQGLLNVVGQNLVITIEMTEHVTVVNQLNAYPMQSSGRSTSFRLGDVFGDEVKALLLELAIPGLKEIGQRQIALLRFEYDELNENGSEHKVWEMPVIVNVTQEDPKQLPNPQVSQSVLLLKAAQARRRAVKEADKGEFKSAASGLIEVAEAIKESPIQNETLADERKALLQQAAEIEQGNEKYNEYSRKMMSTQAFYTMTSRHEDTMVLRAREEERSGSSGTYQQPDTLPEQPKAESGEPSQIAQESEGQDVDQEQPRRRTESVPASVVQDAVDAAEALIPRREGVTPTHMTWNNQTFELQSDLIRVGRARHNEIIIGGSGVSRFHCQLRRIGDQLLLEDLGSTNGTTIRGITLKSAHVLSVGDVVHLCDEKLIFHDGTYRGLE